MQENAVTLLERLQALYEHWCKIEDEASVATPDEITRSLDARGRTRGIKECMEIIESEYASCGCRVAD